MALTRRYPSESRRILYADTQHAAGYVVHGQGSGLHPVLRRPGTDQHPDGLSGGSRQIPSSQCRSRSQIYPELKKMLADNWIVGTQKENNEKEINYSLTKKGALQLENWIKQPITELAVSHDLFSLKLFFINDQNDPRIAELIDEEKALIKSQLQHLYARKK